MHRVVIFLFHTYVIFNKRNLFSTKIVLFARTQNVRGSWRVPFARQNPRKIRKFTLRLPPKNKRKFCMSTYRYRRFRKRYASWRSRYRGVGLQAPVKFYRFLYFHDELFDTGLLGATNTAPFTTFRMNSIYDPWVSGAGTSVAGFGSIFPDFYEAYIVRHASISCSLTMGDGAPSNESFRSLIYPSATDLSGLTITKDLAEQSNLFKRGQLQDFLNPAVKPNRDFFTYPRRPYGGGPADSATYNSNPTASNLWNVTVYTTGVTDISVQITARFRLVYYVVAYNPDESLAG